MITLKLFKTLLVVIPCLIVAVAVVLVWPRREPYDLDETGPVAVSDEPKYVTNSEMSFFYKRDQLKDYREQQKPEPTSYFRMSETFVSTDFTKTNYSVLPDPRENYVGPANVIVLENGETAVFTGVDKNGYLLGSGETVAAGNAFEVVLESNTIGSSATTPHRVKRGVKSYAAFTSKLESLYFEVESENEFLSVTVGGVAGRMEYTLLDSGLNQIKNGWNNSKDTFEIRYKGKGAAKYYIKLTGSYADQLRPFYITYPFDDNEWEWQMRYAAMYAENTGTFDYYGDEDYYLLPPDVTSKINKSVLRFTKAEHQINVVIYDKQKRALGQYVYIPGKTDVISMYGLENAYAAALYSYDGEASGKQYAFCFEYTDISILDIETYGFALSPEFSEEIDYYTASVSSIEGKKITDFMYSEDRATVEISVTQQCGKTLSATMGEDLPLAPGRNTLTLTVTLGGASKEITIVLSDRTYDLSYGYLQHSSVGVYSKASTGSQKITTLSSGTRVLIIENDGASAMVKVQLCNGDKIGSYGYIRRQDVFCGYTATEMPASYATAISALQAQHPNWKFTFVHTGWDFDSYVSSQLGDSSVYNGSHASRDTVQYYVDPRNFLTEQSVFMFEKQTYKENTYSKNGVLSVWNDPVFASYIMDGAESTGLSPYFIVARAALESGRGTSKLASGTVEGYEGYYNFYGIGANDQNPLIGGASTAKNHNWNSKRRAIIEGAAWVKSQYISCQQNTIYFMKFCFVPGRTWHQYMTDVAAPAKDAQNYYKAHRDGGTLNSQIEFVIPVYDNMP